MKQLLDNLRILQSISYMKYNTSAEKVIAYFVGRDIYYFMEDYSLRYVDFNEGFDSIVSYLPVSDIYALASLFDEEVEFIDSEEFIKRKLTYVTDNG